jgi:selenide,water dikinase
MDGAAGRQRPVRADLVLVGGGHTHVQVLRRWMMAPLPGVRLTAVLDRPEAVYSGMVPGFVAGDYAAPQLEIDVVPLARRAGARVLLAAATGLDPEARSLALEGRPPVPYDVLSLDVGSSLRGLDLPGVREHGLATRPIRDLVDAVGARLVGSLGEAPRRIAVVGGGAAGVELAFTLEARLAGEGRPAEITLVSADARLLPGASAALARAAEREAGRRGIALRLRARVASVDGASLQLETGETIPCDLPVWATGAAPSPFLKGLPLPKDAGGFVRVGPTLQVEGRPELFAVGDCAALDHAPWVPKAGVHAVREGPVLDANLRARLSGGRLRRHRPQRDFLALLHLGHGRGLGGKWGAAVSGKSVLRLKDAIDRRFMRRFQVLQPDGADAPGFPSPESMGMEPMSCGGCAAKVEAEGLAATLARLPTPPADAEVVLGVADADDVAAWRTAGGPIRLGTVDGFRAFTDDPWLVGRVAAVNAVSDVQASGGAPRQALAWVHVPEAEGGRRGQETLYQVLAGVRAALDPLGVSLLGGHSTIGAELMVGLAIMGELRESGAMGGPWPKGGLTAGDRLVLTKPLGTGVVLAADMQGRAPGAAVAAAHHAMLRSNGPAADGVARIGARGCTDVSGFGLAVHLGEMLRASGVSAQLDAAALPALPGARDLLARGLRSTAHDANASAALPFLAKAEVLDDPALALAFDPQTAGGMLIGVAAGQERELLDALAEGGDDAAVAVGSVCEAGAGGPRILL